MSHSIRTPDPPCRTNMTQEMNEAAHHVIRAKRMHWEPWLAEHPLVYVNMRDAIHPGRPANIAHMKALFTKIQEDLNKPRKSHSSHLH